MADQPWVEPIASMTVDGPAVGNSTSESTLLIGQAKPVQSARLLDRPGRTVRITAMGRVSNIVTTPGTLTLRLKWGSTTILTSPAMALNTAAKTNVLWLLEWTLVMRTVGDGTSATAMHFGRWQSESVIGAPAANAGGIPMHTWPSSAPAVGSGFNSTAGALIDLTAQWSVANAGNTLQAHTYFAESVV